jgi:anti-anti-sigma factor
MQIIQKLTNPGETALILAGQLNFLVRKDLQAALHNAQIEGIHHIILDLTQVSFIDCSALGILVQAKQELAEAQITLSFLTSPGRVSDVLKLLNSNKKLSIFPA